MNSEIIIYGYALYRTDRAANRKKGGVITYVHNTYSASVEVLAAGSNAYAEYHMLYIKQLSLVVINLYRPPECPGNLFTSSLQDIRTKLNAVSTHMPNVIVMGDFNFPTIDWNTERVIGRGAEYRLQAETLMEFSKDFCLQQYISTHTREDSILDLFFTNKEDIVQEYDLSPWKLSDHRLITIKTTVMKYQVDESQTEKQSTGFNRLNLFSPRTNWTAIKKELSQVCWHSFEGNQHPVCLYERIMQVCLEVCSLYSPKRRVDKLKNTIPRDRRVMMRKRAARKRLKLVKSQYNKRLMEERLERMEQELNDSVLREQELAEKTAVEAIKTSPKYFYTFVRNKSKLKTDIITLTGADGNLPSDPITTYVRSSASNSQGYLVHQLKQKSYKTLTFLLVM